MGRKKRINRITPFAEKVYAAVSAIPRGETRSYSWVAARIGRPGACRAVGNALNKNPFFPAVPCHRVVKSDGSPGGFARGRKAKERLLAEEGYKPLDRRLRRKYNQKATVTEKGKND